MEKIEVQKFNLTVETGDQASEVFVIDSKFQKVASGLGDNTRFELPIGLYTVKVREGNTINEQSMGLFGNQSVRFDPVKFSTPAPLETTSQATQNDIQKAQYHSNVKNISIGEGSQVYIFAREWKEASTSGAKNSPKIDPATGLTLRDLDNKILVDFGSPDVGEFAIEENRWSACNVELNPGIYIFSLGTASGDIIQQTIVASPGWQTQIFLLQKDYGVKKKDIRADLANSSILIARIGKGFVPDDPNFRLTELAKFALINNRQVLTEEVINQLLDEKFTNPMLGIYAIHSLIEDESKWDQVKGIVENLRSFLGKTHSDVEAVALKLNMPSEFIFNAPPMLKKSWKYVLDASVKQPQLVPEASLASKIAGKLLVGDPWLLWGEFAKPIDTEKILTDQLKNLISITTSSGASNISGEGTMADFDIAPEGKEQISFKTMKNNFNVSAILNNSEEQSKLVGMLGVPKAKLNSMLNQLNTDSD